MLLFLDEMEFSNWLCLPTQEFSPQVPLCSLVLCPLLSNLLRPEDPSLRGGIPTSFSFWRVGLQENELDNVKVLRERRKSFLLLGCAENRLSSQRERANVGQMQPSLECVSVSPRVEARGKVWMRALGGCFK